MTKTKRNAIIAIQAALLPIAVVALLLCLQKKPDEMPDPAAAAIATTAAERGEDRGDGDESEAPDGVWEPDDDDPSSDGDGDESGDGGNDDEEEVEIEVDGEEDEDDKAEKLVDDFDSTVDRWMNPTTGDVPMSEVNAFVAKFKALPKDRMEECLQRALNLVPDDHVMLLVGLLMDKSLDQDYIEAIFNDLLNRDEDVKKTVMNEILKDKTHPCWPNVAWINDATGQKNDNSDENSEEE